MARATTPSATMPVLALAACALALLPGVPRAGNLSSEGRCAEADVHAAEAVANDGPGAADAYAESALEAEASRTLPTVGSDGDGAARPHAGEALAAGGADDAADAEDAEDARDAADLGFRDSQSIKARARAWRELKLVRLWDTRSVMVWLGLDRKGRPGVHFRQRNADDAPAPAPAPLAYVADAPEPGVTAP